MENKWNKKTQNTHGFENNNKSLVNFQVKTLLIIFWEGGGSVSTIFPIFRNILPTIPQSFLYTHIRNPQDMQRLMLSGEQQLQFGQVTTFAFLRIWEALSYSGYAECNNFGARWKAYLLRKELQDSWPQPDINYFTLYLFSHQTRNGFSRLIGAIWYVMYASQLIW